MWKRNTLTIGIGVKGLNSVKEIILSSLHIKLGLVEQFVKKHCQKFLTGLNICENFSQLFESKIKDDIFIFPFIKKLMCDKK